MGYTTEFEGRFNLNKKIEDKHSLFLSNYTKTRHCSYKVKASKCMNNVNILPGEFGEFFAPDNADYYNSRYERFITEMNNNPNTPGLWCHWVPTEDSLGIEWDGGEKFYDYVEWLNFIIKHFLTPWGYELSGSVHFQGEDPNDFGILKVKDNLAFVNKEIEIFR